ncbi:hypothetical protein GQ600_7134 [Phytophthora cactorum]|nr:hypothetical protein GQ600_7134 [Phytophthora cactorum]
MGWKLRLMRKTVRVALLLRRARLQTHRDGCSKGGQMEAQESSKGPERRGLAPEMAGLAPQYLTNNASSDYVLHAGYRLYTLVVERRFKEHLRVVRAQLRQKWPDETPGEQAERCKGSLSYWDCKTPAHRERLQQLMKEWIVTKDLPQSEIEQRLRFFHFENTERLLWSLRAAANGERSYSTLDGEARQLLPTVSATSTNGKQLRTRSPDEDKAIQMILNHELESMTALELAFFTDLFMAIEYPLYAHLAPGQKFGANMSQYTLFAQIQMGAEAAGPPKPEIAEFKSRGT